MPNNTIFDDVFRTMLEKMPYLAVPLINEVFHTSYPQDVKITQLRNEYMEKDGKCYNCKRSIYGPVIQKCTNKCMKNMIHRKNIVIKETHQRIGEKICHILKISNTKK